MNRNTCTCAHTDAPIPRITRGNDFTAHITVTRQDGEDFDITKSTGISVSLVSRFGKRKKMEYSIKDGVILVRFEETLPCGLYGIEIKGKDENGNDWRYYAQPGEFIQVVENTSEATTSFPSTSGNVDITAKIGLFTGSVATAIYEALDRKVDKEDGKGLSTNDYTTEEKNKLGGIAENATADSAIPAGTSGDAAATDGTLATASVNAMIKAYL